MKKLLLFIFFLASCTSATPVTPTASPTILPTQTTTATPKPTQTPKVFTATPTQTPTPTQDLFYTIKPGDTLGSIAVKLKMDVYDLARINHLPDINLIYADQVLLVSDLGPVSTPSPTITRGKQIMVSLSTQRAYAYEDGILQKEFIVSTGVKAFPTVIGQYEIYVKYNKTRMTGPGYDIPDVPWVMYFFKGYGFHGAYWHNNFGTPMSHGCVNLKVDEAEWLYQWAPIGTPVLVLP